MLKTLTNHWAGFVATAPNPPVVAPAPSPVIQPPPPSVPVENDNDAVRGASPEPTTSIYDIPNRPAEPFTPEPIAGDDTLKSIAKAGLVGSLVGGAVFALPRVLKYFRKVWPR